MSGNVRRNLVTALALAFAVTMGADLEAAPIHDAAQAGDLEQLKHLLAADGTLISALEPMGTPLHHALFGQQLEVVEYLLAEGADVNSSHPGTGFTPLHASVYGPDQTFAELLIRHGAEVNRRGTRGYSPLDLAIIFGKNATAGVLIDHGADMAGLNGQGKLPLYHAAELGRVEVVEHLLEAGANVNACNQRGETAFHVAVAGGRLEVVEQLLSHGAMANSVAMSTGRTPLQIACLGGYATVVDKILAAGGGVQETDAAGRTALYYAARYGHRQIANLLLSHGAKRTEDLPENVGNAPWLKRDLGPGQMVAWYLNHRGWAVKTPGHLLVFDAEEFGVVRPTEPSLANGFLTPGELRDQNLVGLFTCYHGDPGERAYVHTLADKVASASYVHLEADRFRDDDFSIYLEPSQQRQIGGVNVRTIDAFTGNATLAYLVDADEVTIFYMGFNVMDASEFITAVDELATGITGVDVAFLPIPDPDTPDGVLAHVLKKLRPRAVCLLDPNRQEGLFPGVAEAIGAAGYSGRVFCAENPGDVFEFIEPASN